MKKGICILAALFTLAVSTVVFAESNQNYGRGGAYCDGSYCDDSYSDNGGNCRGGACGWRR